jgi:hypothetical protein
MTREALKTRTSWAVRDPLRRRRLIVERNSGGHAAESEMTGTALERATVRELIVQLARAEDAMRHHRDRHAAPAAAHAEAIVHELHSRSQEVAR